MSSSTAEGPDAESYPPRELGTRTGRYELMQLSRRFEETMHDQFGDGQIPGPLHLSIGQEAVAVGACAPLRPSDAVVSTHRGHHHCLAKGARPERLMAELLGRTAGYSGGRSGSMHVAIPSIGLIGTNGIVGAGLPIATGCAYGMQAQARDDVTVCFFGEGATGTGAFYEAINIAALWSLPLVFVCENNQFVELTPQAIHVPGEIWRRGESHGIPGRRVDGNDVEEMADAVRTAVELARGGGGPTLIEALTYRWFGHYAGDRAAWRVEEEVQQWRERDPLIRSRAALEPERADAIDAKVEERIAAALAFAQASPLAGPDAMFPNHYASAS